MYQALSHWRAEPFRPLFPLGVALAWAGVLPWLLLGVGLTSGYHSVFHSMAQMQAFMSCFAAGFLFTFVPRRTGTELPASWQLLAALTAPLGVVLFAYLELWALSQAAWLALALVLLDFSARRFASAGGQNLGAGFIFVPLSFAAGVLGSLLAWLGAMQGEAWMWLHDVGRGMVLQGLGASLVLGVGGTLLPVLLYGQPRSEGAFRRGLLSHLLLAGLFYSSFWLEALIEARLAYAIRMAVPLYLLVRLGLFRLPKLAGLHRQLIWAAAWMVPLGYALLVALPAYRRAGLHVVFIGGFALMVLSVSTQIILAHGGRLSLLSKRPWQLFGVAGLIGLALVQRVLAEVNPPHFRLWLSGAAISFLAATLCWAGFLLLGQGERRAAST